MTRLKTKMVNLEDMIMVIRGSALSDRQSCSLKRKTCPVKSDVLENKTWIDNYLDDTFVQGENC